VGRAPSQRGTDGGGQEGSEGCLWRIWLKKSLKGSFGGPGQTHSGEDRQSGGSGRPQRLRPAWDQSRQWGRALLASSDFGRWLQAGIHRARRLVLAAAIVPAAESA